MSAVFSNLNEILPNNVIIGKKFDVMKRSPNNSFGYNQNVFRFNHNERLIPSRCEVTSDFLQETQVQLFDVSSADNSMKTMKKVQYQNHLRKLFLENQQQKSNERRVKKNNTSTAIKLLHADWACKLSNFRCKFMPDFETLKKPGFGFIKHYIWSSKQIIAASSRRKVCLYHPFNGFTRALDVIGTVCLAFSNSGNYLAMAYRKSHRNSAEHDLFVFHIEHSTLFDREHLETEKLRTETSQDITAMCYTRNDDFLMCGTNSGHIMILECTVQHTQKTHKWTYVKQLSSSHHRDDITKICFSAKYRFMATLDLHGLVVIWNGGSWTQLFCLQKEDSKLYTHLAWHPFVEEELILGKSIYPALYLINVVQKKVMACYMNWTEGTEITSIAFNPVTAQLAVCFYMKEDYINRVSILASMSQVINTFDFNYIYGGLKLFWNSTGTMLGAGAHCFRFAFWSFQKDHNFPEHVIKGSTSKNPELITALNDSKLNSLR